MARSKLRLLPSSGGSTALDLSAGTANVAINTIQPRRDGDSRPLNAEHVVTLAESIAALGILEPVVVDQDGHLLAGGHRLAALHLLAQSQPMARRKDVQSRLRLNDQPLPEPEEGKGLSQPIQDLLDRVAQLDSDSFKTKYRDMKVPAVVVEIDGKDATAQALAIEAAENSVRRQYSRAEVAELAGKLKKAGYTSRPGRPKKGERSARPVLEALLGCSGRHLSRLLGDEPVTTKSEWDLAVRAMERAAKKLLEAGKSKRSEDAKRLVQLAEQVLWPNKP